MMTMTNTAPEVKPLGKYTTAETCRHLGITYKTLVKYTIERKIKHKLSKDNKRIFYGKDILKFWEDH